MSFDHFNFSRPAEPPAIQPAWDPPPVEPGANVPPRPRDHVWLHVLLFVLTIGTTVVVGAGHYASFIGDLGAGDVDMTLGQLLVRGAWYAGTILAILGTHEFGHYAACRYYGVNASLPYFLPAPLILTGTLGAFIRIRDPIPTKPMLFDIGVAGPIAGFVVAVPALFVGLSLSRVVELPPDFSGLSLGEPLLFQAAAWLLWGSTPDGYSLNLHPMAFRSLVRTARHRTEPVPDRSARWRPYLVRGSGLSLDAGYDRHGRDRGRADILLAELARVGRAHGGHAHLLRSAASSHPGRPRSHSIPPGAGSRSRPP